MTKFSARTERGIVAAVTGLLAGLVASAGPVAAQDLCSCLDRQSIDWRIKEVDFLIKGFAAEKARISSTQKFTQADYNAFSHGPLQTALNTFKSSSKGTTPTWAARTDPVSCNTELPAAATPCMRSMLELHEAHHRSVCNSRQNFARVIAMTDYRAEQTLADVYQEEVDAYTIEKKALEKARASLPGGGEPVLIYEVMLRGQGLGGNLKWRVNRRYDGKVVLNARVPLATGPQAPPPPPPSRNMTPQQAQQYAQQVQQYMQQAQGQGETLLWSPGATPGTAVQKMNVSINDEIVSRSQDVCTKEWATTTWTYEGDGQDENSGPFQYDENTKGKLFNVLINLAPLGKASYTESSTTQVDGKKSTSTPPKSVPFSHIVWPDIPDVVKGLKVKHAQWQTLPPDTKVIRYDSGWVKPDLSKGPNYPQADTNLKMKVYYQIAKCE